MLSATAAGREGGGGREEASEATTASLPRMAVLAVMAVVCFFLNQTRSRKMTRTANSTKKTRFLFEEEAADGASTALLARPRLPSFPPTTRFASSSACSCMTSTSGFVGEIRGAFRS